MLARITGLFENGNADRKDHNASEAGGRLCNACKTR